MLITEFLMSDHARFRQLLDVLETAVRHNKVSALNGLRDTLLELTTFERSHESIEEELLLPLLKKAPGIDPKVIAGFEKAHRDIERRIRDVETCCREEYPLATTQRAVAEYSQALREHLRGEEAGLFPEVEKALSPEDSESLAETAAAREARDWTKPARA